MASRKRWLIWSSVTLPSARQKSSGGLSEDILDDGLGQVVLLGDRADGFARSPECDNVLDFDLVGGEDRGAPAEAGVDDDLGTGGVLGQPEPDGGAGVVPVDVVQVVLKDVLDGVLVVSGADLGLIGQADEDGDAVGGDSAFGQGVRVVELGAHDRCCPADVVHRQTGGA